MDCVRGIKYSLTGKTDTGQLQHSWRQVDIFTTLPKFKPEPSLTAATMANLAQQSVNMTAPDGSSIPVPLPEVDATTTIMVINSAAYGAEMGASIVMLAVILTMTPKAKFWRFHTYLNIAQLCNNIVRVLLLIMYFESSWVSFYALYSGDYEYVARADVATSVAGTILIVPQNAMMMLALVLQAWVMVQLWPRAYKVAIILASVVLVLLEIGFMAATEAYQITSMFMGPGEALTLIMRHMWVRSCFLGLEVACISWFCVLFISKLVTHLWQNRSFLPTRKGLGAMDALVMTNGVLMLIPVILVGLQYCESVKWEPASMLYTSVIVTLPLGTLVGQRIADPAAFQSDFSTPTTRISNKARDRFENYASSSSNKGALLNGTWSQSDRDGAVYSGRRGSSNVFSGKTTGVTAYVTSRGPMTSTDIELARIDAEFEAGQVRIDREIQRLEEHL